MKRSLLAFCAGVCLVGALLSACGGSGQDYLPILLKIYRILILI